MPKMTPEQIRAFVAADPAHTGKLAFTAKDGSPRVVPIWFIVEGGDLVFNTGSATLKGRAIARDPRIALCVDDERPPFSYVTVRGEARISEDPEDRRRTAAEIGGRYMGPDRAEEYGERNGVPGELVVRLSLAGAHGVMDIAD
jgi:PPOX class probable F420-dependent enzyme